MVGQFQHRENGDRRVPHNEPLSLYSLVPPGPVDRSKEFSLDPNPNKVDLRIGIYRDDRGRTLKLEVVQEAIERVLKTHKESGYLPTVGDPGYAYQVQRLLFGEDSEILNEQRVATVQSIGGSNALRLAADFIKTHFSQMKIFVSSPSWGDHGRIFARAGLKVDSYPYYNMESHSLDFEALCNFVLSLKESCVMIFQGSCHNPTAEDLSMQQWDHLIGLLKNSKVLPIIDLPYQGFGTGIEEDAYAVRKMVEEELPLMVASSFCKSFSLYEERVGALSILPRDERERKNVLSQLKTEIRTNFSSPTAFGSRIVTSILADSKLRERWEGEVNEMRSHLLKKTRAAYEGF